MQPSFADLPLARCEEADEECARVERLKREDPIALQDAVNTSTALVDAVKEGDLEELQSVVANAVEGEFLQAFVLQAFVMALKRVSLELVTALVKWGAPVGDEQLTQSLHLLCEVTTRDNFSDAWRIVKLLVEGSTEGRIDINTPRLHDGWTPLCVACHNACLPLAFKLLELDADPNVITRANDTPISIVKHAQSDDTEQQQEARGLIENMLRHYGGQESWRMALAKSRRPRERPPHIGGDDDDGDDREEGCMGVAAQAVSQTHTRFCG